MTVLLESALTTELCEHLAILEPGLRLITSPYRLGDALGTGGYVDILAQDYSDRFVIIKVKHPRESARQVTHEAARHSEMFARSKGLDPDQVRVMVVSSDWAELIVPFSYQQRHLNHELQGFALHMARGVIVAAEEVAPLPAIPEHDLSPVHHVIRFDTAEAREAGWTLARNHLHAVGADNLLRLDFEIDPKVQANDRFAAYLVIGPVSPSDPRTRVLQDYAWVDEDAPAGRVLENRALTELIRWASDTGLTALSAYESGYPEKLAQLMRPKSGWHYKAMSRFGLYVEQQDELSDEAILEHLTISRMGQARFTATSTPMQREGWARLQTRVGESLMGNDVWSTGVLHWLDEICAARPDATVTVAIHNPCDVIATLSGALQRAGRTGGVAAGNDRAPDLACVEAAGRTGVARRLTGTIMWRGRLKLDAARLVRMVYPEPTIYAAQRIMGLTFSDDETLMSVLGLEYCLLEQVTGGADSLISVIDGRLHRRPSDRVGESGDPAWSGYLPVQDFLDLHLAELAGFVRNCVAASR